MNDCFISVILPAYNEEKRITPTLHTIYDYLSNQNYSFEIILVDDGSTDTTVQLMKNFRSDDKSITVLINDENRGKGYTVRKGMLFANGKYIFFTDADLSTPIEEIEKCLPYLKDNYDIVIGSRSLPDSNIIIHQPWYREKMGKIFNFMVKILLLKGIIDTQCGFKGFKKQAVKTVFNKCVIDGFSFDVETILLARKYNCSIKEIPVIWTNSPLSKVNPVKHSIQMFIDLIAIRINDLKGIYD
ncbi:MAG: dolichyl-phosphate beta-glucosyltransferase [Candidatus Anammoxibacter sp.]